MTNTLSKIVILIFAFHSSLLYSQFKDVTVEARIRHLIDFELSAMGGGAVFFDFNNDGFEDLYITGGQQADQLYQNLGNGSFYDVSSISGVHSLTNNKYTFGVIAGDINNDGCDDLFVTTFDRSISNFLLLNNCYGGFQDIAWDAGLKEKSASTSAAFLDINQDGYLDLYVTNYIDQFQFITNDQGEIIDIQRHCLPNFFYLNQGNLKFEEVSQEWKLNDAGCGLAVISTDYDMDGDSDIYLANDHGEWVESNKLFRNDYPESKVTDVSFITGTDIGFYAMGVANGDYNGDGMMDYYVTNLGNNALLKSLDYGFYGEASASAGVSNGFYENDNSVVGWGTFFFDFDHDLDLDLFVSNGYIRAGFFSHTTQKNDRDILFENLGNGQFMESSYSFEAHTNQINRGAIYGDYDRDGDLDIFSVSAVENANEYSALFNNQLISGNWLKLHLEGIQSNRNGFGSVIRAYEGDHQLIRELASGGSHASQNSNIIHFGLTDVENLDSLVILWPSGISDHFYSVPTNKQYYCKEGYSDLQIEGCMDPDSPSYDPSATHDTACFYEPVLACTDPLALNYDQSATIDDQSCSYTTSSVEENFVVADFEIIPNPAKQFFQIERRKHPQSSPEVLKIMNSVGNLLIEMEIENSSQRIDISTLPPGIYFVKVTGSSKGDCYLSKKLVVI